MAALTTSERNETMRAFVRRAFVELNQTANLDTVEVRQLVDAIDDWAEANAGSLNGAIPAALRAKATAGQKATALAFVALRRAGVTL